MKKYRDIPPYSKCVQLSIDLFVKFFSESRITYKCFDDQNNFNCPKVGIEYVSKTIISRSNKKMCHK